MSGTEIDLKPTQLKISEREKQVQCHQEKINEIFNNNQEIIQHEFVEKRKSDHFINAEDTHKNVNSLSNNLKDNFSKHCPLGISKKSFGNTSQNANSNHYNLRNTHEIANHNLKKSQKCDIANSNKETNQKSNRQ